MRTIADLDQPTRKPRGIGTPIIRPVAFAIKACYTHGASVMVTNAAGELLFVRQNTRERGYWGFPGGFMSSCEEPAEGAARELREEAALVVTPAELEQLAEYKQPWAKHYEHLFGVVIPGDGSQVTRRSNARRRLTEIRALDFFAIDDLPEKITAATNEALVRLHTSGKLTATP